MDQHLRLLYLLIRDLLNLRRHQLLRRAMMLRLRITARRVEQAMTEAVLHRRYLLLPVAAITAVLHRVVREGTIPLHVRANPDL